MDIANLFLHRMVTKIGNKNEFEVTFLPEGYPLTVSLALDANYMVSPRPDVVHHFQVTEGERITIPTRAITTTRLNANNKETISELIKQLDLDMKLIGSRFLSLGVPTIRLPIKKKLYVRHVIGPIDTGDNIRYALAEVGLLVHDR